jgi:hypothetical protein
MTDRELMQQALSTLEGWAGHGKWVWPESALEQAKRNTAEAIAALRERLAQPEQEPVAWVYQEGLEALKSGRPWTAYGSNGYSRIPLYLNDAVARRVEPPAAESGAGFESLPASPQWQGLTDEEIWDEWCNQTKPERDTRNFVAAFALAIEAKLKEKNT